MLAYTFKKFIKSIRNFLSNSAKWQIDKWEMLQQIKSKT